MTSVSGRARRFVKQRKMARSRLGFILNIIVTTMVIFFDHGCFYYSFIEQHIVGTDCILYLIFCKKFPHSIRLWGFSISQSSQREIISRFFCFAYFTVYAVPPVSFVR